MKVLGDQQAVVRNGYLPAREVLTAIGPVEVRVPKMRDRSVPIKTFQHLMLHPPPAGTTNFPALFTGSVLDSPRICAQLGPVPIRQLIPMIRRQLAGLVIDQDPAILGLQQQINSAIQNLPGLENPLHRNFRMRSRSRPATFQPGVECPYLS